MHKKNINLHKNRNFALLLVLGGTLSVIIPGLFGLGNYHINQVYLQQEASLETPDILQINIRLGDVGKTLIKPNAQLLIRDSQTLDTIIDRRIEMEQNQWGDFVAKLQMSNGLHPNLVDVLIKPEQHRQLKFDKVKIGNSGILDLTTRIIPSGDLPYAAGQDHKTNQGDYYALISDIGSQGRIGDLNYDGEVNALDRSILLKNWLDK